MYNIRYICMCILITCTVLIDWLIYLILTEEAFSLQRTLPGAQWTCTHTYVHIQKHESQSVCKSVRAVLFVGVPLFFSTAPEGDPWPSHCLWSSILTYAARPPATPIVTYIQCKLYMYNIHRLYVTMRSTGKFLLCLPATICTQWYAHCYTPGLYGSEWKWLPFTNVSLSLHCASNDIERNESSSPTLPNINDIHCEIENTSE